MDDKSIGRDRNHYLETRPSRKEKHGRKKTKLRSVLIDVFIRTLLSRLFTEVFNIVSRFVLRIIDMISNLLYQKNKVIFMRIPENHAFYQLKSKKRLAAILGIDSPAFFKHLDLHFTCTEFSLTKNNKTRTLLNPSKQYKRILRKINQLLQGINFPTYLHSGVKQKNALSNACYHNSHSHICTMDIKNFFPSTSEAFVYKFFKDKFKMSEDVAKIMTLLVTYKNENEVARLPQGFPTSSILSYLVYFDFFNGVNALAHSRNMKFSIYVDDLTFSSNRAFTPSFLNRIVTIAQQYELTIHPDKTQFYNRHAHKKITGVILKQETVRAPLFIHKQINQHYLDILDCDLLTFSNFIKFKQKVIKTLGQIQYVRSIEGTHKYISIERNLNDFKEHFSVLSVKDKYRIQLKQEYKHFQGMFTHSIIF
ncbi:reverse transcriptase family protein [Alkalicoccobacillus gibsonii]|uniref:reverse transcriptase family protein n=1 Tax=Alkalicoccobacillus gibsonii TaxID=79881 RepID=UPI0019342BC7|nr:reverse transcriptase family protein [Alkalicoccobacillus gibsonii]MBM0065955.1 RNA-directed DNA polymerase [Alkalicoccobacillus gibsonii]